MKKAKGFSNEEIKYECNLHGETNSILIVKRKEIESTKEEIK